MPDLKRVLISLIFIPLLLLQTHPITDFGNGHVSISGSSLEAGMYVYALVVDGQIIDSKRMILTK